MKIMNLFCCFSIVFLVSKSWAESSFFRYSGDYIATNDLTSKVVPKSKRCSPSSSVFFQGFRIASNTKEAAFWVFTKNGGKQLFLMTEDGWTGDEGQYGQSRFTFLSDGSPSWDYYSTFQGFRSLNLKSLPQNQFIIYFTYASCTRAYLSYRK